MAMEPVASLSRAAFQAAARQHELSTVRAYFAQPSVVREVLEIESYVAGLGREVFRAGGYTRLPIKETLRQRGAWLVSSEYYADTVFHRFFSMLDVRVLGWFYGREPSELVEIARLIPNTLGFLLYELLCPCASTGNEEALEILLESPIMCEFFDARERQWLLNVAACVAVVSRSLKTFDKLIAHGANVDDAHLMLHPVEHMGVEELRCTVESGVNVVGRRAVLLVAVGARSSSAEELARELIRMGVDLDCVQNTALHVAAKEHKPVMVRLLFDEGFADIDARDSTGATPLICAVKHSDSSSTPAMSTLEVLVELGADINAQDNDGRTALSYASINCEPQITRMLLDHGADPNLCDSKGQSPMHFAAKSRTDIAERCQLLLNHGADPNACANGSFSPLHALCSSISEPSSVLAAIKLLLDHGADPNLTEKSGETPLHVYLSRGLPTDAAIVSLLQGATDLDLADVEGTTCRQLLASPVVSVPPHPAMDDGEFMFVFNG